MRLQHEDKSLHPEGMKLRPAAQAILARELAKIPSPDDLTPEEASEIGRRVAAAAEQQASPLRRRDPHKHLLGPQGLGETSALEAAEHDYSKAAHGMFEAQRDAQKAAEAFDRVRDTWASLRREDEVDPAIRRRVQADGAAAQRLKDETAGSVRERQQEMEEAGQRLADVRNEIARAGRKRYHEARKQDGSL